jgi:Leucine-rich repeat (LRR) protein
VSLNGLEDIPGDLGSMSKLESLNMNDNRMKTVPDVVRFARSGEQRAGIPLAPPRRQLARRPRGRCPDVLPPH